LELQLLNISRDETVLLQVLPRITLQVATLRDPDP
jgi:hypothetical protein